MSAAAVRAFALALLVALASPIPEAAIADERPLTLEEAIAFALDKNEVIAIGREAQAAADATITEAKGAYDPVLELDAGWRKTAEPVNSAFSGVPDGSAALETEGTEAGMRVRQLLPTGGALSFRSRAARGTTDGTSILLSPAYDTRIGVELRQPLLKNRAVDPARLSRDVAASDYDEATAVFSRTVVETVAAVEHAYWRLVAARQAIEVREEALRLAEEQLAETRSRIESGTVPETEISQPLAELERRRGELLGSRETSANAENGLKRLILDDTDDELWLDRLTPVHDSALELVPVNAELAMRQALAARPEVKAANAAVERRRAETAFAKDGVWPTLDAVLSYDRFGLAGSENPNLSPLPGGGKSQGVPPNMQGELGDSFDTLSDGDFDDAQIALVFGIPLSNRTARANADVARSVERQAQSELARTRKLIRVEVLDAAAALETAGQRIEAARSARSAAEVQLTSERERYATGLSTNFLVLTRQNDLSRARLDEISAITDYRTARTEMARVTGSLLRERNIHVDTK